MAKHEQGTVRVIPAEPTHMYHQMNFKDRVIIYPVETIHEPGRHRYDDMYAVNSPFAVFLVDDSVHGPSFECPREWVDGMAVGFDYLSV